MTPVAAFQGNGVIAVFFRGCPDHDAAVRAVLARCSDHGITPKVFNLRPGDFAIQVADSEARALAAATGLKVKVAG